MGYHMSRVMHWIQQGTVAHYPTHNLKQLYQNPGSEFAITQFQLLSGGDYFANSVQWGSMVMSLVGVSLIARQLGCDRRGQLLAVVLCATIPMGILQAASTQNDYVLSLWLVCFTYFSLLIVQAGVTRSTAIYIGASLGLVILSKGTGYIYAFPPQSSSTHLDNSATAALPCTLGVSVNGDRPNSKYWPLFTQSSPKWLTFRGRCERRNQQYFFPPRDDC